MHKGFQLRGDIIESGHAFERQLEATVRYIATGEDKAASSSAASYSNTQSEMCQVLKNMLLIPSWKHIRYRDRLVCTVSLKQLISGCFICFFQLWYSLIVIFVIKFSMKVRRHKRDTSPSASQTFPLWHLPHLPLDCTLTYSLSNFKNLHVSYFAIYVKHTSNSCTVLGTPPSSLSSSLHMSPLSSLSLGLRKRKILCVFPRCSVYYQENNEHHIAYIGRNVQ